MAKGWTVQELSNRLERLGEDREVIVRVAERFAGGVTPAGSHVIPPTQQPVLEYDVIGVEVEGDDPETGTAVLQLREREAGA